MFCSRLQSTASEAEDSSDTAGGSGTPATQPQQSASLVAAIAVGAAPSGDLKELDFDAGKLVYMMRCKVSTD